MCLGNVRLFNQLIFSTNLFVQVFTFQIKNDSKTYTGTPATFANIPQGDDEMYLKSLGYNSVRRHKDQKVDHVITSSLENTEDGVMIVDERPGGMAGLKCAC